MAITYRSFQETDIPAVVRLANINEEQQNSAERSTVEGLQRLIAAPYIHATQDFFVAVNEAEEVLGGSLMLVNAESGKATIDVVAYPDEQAQLVAAGLLECIQARVLQRADAEFAEAAAVYVLAGVPERKAYLQAALEEAGYAEVRRFYTMHIALDTPLAQAQIPQGFSLRPFEKERDAQAVYAVFQECFANHWGAVAQIPYEQWAYQFESDHFDPTLWYILYHNQDIAAICLCEVTARDETLGLVETLGVRPTYRHQGLGKLLLQHSFHEFQQRGYQQVMLDVDAENKTNAVVLYEKAGMSTYHCKIAYRKVLRGDPSAIDEND